MNIEQKVAFWAKTEPSKQALVWRGGSFTYDELNGNVNRLAGGLREMGVKKGDRVAVQLLNDPEFVLSYLALFRLGAILVPLNPLYTEREIGTILEDALPVAAITSDPFAANMLKVRQYLTSLQRVIMVQGTGQEGVIDFSGLMAGSSASFAGSCEIDQGDIAEIIYTSGTTGAPKGAMLTHNNLTSNIRAIAEDELRITSR